MRTSFEIEFSSAPAPNATYNIVSGNKLLNVPIEKHPQCVWIHGKKLSKSMGNACMFYSRWAKRHNGCVDDEEHTKRTAENEQPETRVVLESNAGYSIPQTLMI